MPICDEFIVNEGYSEDKTLDLIKSNGSFYRYRVDSGWFQKQTRIIRNNGEIKTNLGAWGLKRQMAVS